MYVLGRQGLALPMVLAVLLHFQLTDQTLTTRPQNVTVSTGKSASFRCGMSPAPATFNFTIHNSYGNSIVHCPGDTAIYTPQQSLTGQCVVKDNEQLAIWTISVTNLQNNGTYVKCQALNMTAVYGYLWVQENSGFYGTLIGCVMGGFFGILIVFVVSYVILRRSERFQKCFRGKEQDDINTIMEGSKG